MSLNFVNYDWILLFIYFIFYNLFKIKLNQIFIFIKYWTYFIHIYKYFTDLIFT